MILTPEQQDDLRRLLAEELRRACDTAAAAGAGPAAVSRTLDERRTAIAASIPAGSLRSDSLPGNDQQGLGDDPVEDQGVGD